MAPPPRAPQLGFRVPFLSARSSRLGHVAYVTGRPIPGPTHRWFITGKAVC